MEPNTEAVLIAGLVEKEEEACRHFVHLYQDNVYGQSFRMLGNKADAEEATQDTLVKAISRINDFKGDSKLGTWLFRITYTTCLDRLKKRKKLRNEVDIETQDIPSWEYIDSAVDELEEKEQQEAIGTALEKLGGIDAMLIDLFHLQEMNINEIEQITGLKHSAVKVRLMRARKKLALHLEQCLPLETIKEFTHARG